MRRRLCERFRERLVGMEGWQSRLAVWERDCRDVGADVRPPDTNRASAEPPRATRTAAQREKNLQTAVACRAEKLAKREQRLRALIALLSDESIQGEELDQRAMEIERQ